MIFVIREALALHWEARGFKNVAGFRPDLFPLRDIFLSSISSLGVPLLVSIDDIIFK